ncbi:protein adenylyltransferase SelO [Nitrincola alkalilacustris]|uniref:protein adenylyltransferase SelO n=1 Tax=Nitrincola alkalilacustris TaxID=1571224 RepID=UPI00124E8026|nr:YdiU family protein [Nitrincola alkalilacustris]
MASHHHTLEQLNFDNSYARLPETWYQRTQIQPLKNAHLISFNPQVASLLDLDPCRVNPDQLAYYFGGGGVLPGTEPLAMKYTGHQFGVYNPQLGDGRGLLLGEVLNHKGVRWDLHLKGAGRTAFSRFGDGRAVLRSSIREYLVSEAMHGLGIPTTRALCLIGSEEYTMRQGMEPCAMLLRVTRSHIRFGHFEYFYYSNRHDELAQLADYCIERYYPECRQAENPVSAMLDEVIERTARLVAQWQSYGFVHGVLNTDNMSILGETFDYGPYTFMDEYKPSLVSNSNDHDARYAFERQPAIVMWNLACLAQALLPLVPREELEAHLDSFQARFETHELDIKRRRLGLLTHQPGDDELIVNLWQLMADQRLDLNRLLRALAQFHPSQPESRTAALSLTSAEQPLSAWLDRYADRIALEAASQPIRRQQMHAMNPLFVLRNYMAEEAIRAATQGDYRLVNELLGLLRHPGQHNDDMIQYASTPPDWAAGICLSCSS